jgi:NAD(P)-dependent dehydrogenase (short-subunit alcohol dehydrogenase family)
MDNKPMDLIDRPALVTGASRGLGAALTRLLAARGARVVAVARDGVALRSVVDGIVAAGGIAHGIAADVADKDAVYRIAGTAAELVGPIDLLVHNASSLGPTPLRLLLDTECEDLERVLGVNLVGPFRLTKAVAGSMALRRTGTIVFVSSDAAVEAYPHWGAYSVSKAAADHLAKILAAELDEHGVRVFSVDPGEMDTDMHRAAIPDADPATLADPSAIARVVVDMISRADGVSNGARLVAGQWEHAP